jgi:hypothetical protein
MARRSRVERSSSLHDRRQPVQALGKPATPLWFFTLTPSIVILLFCFGLWWLVWRLTSP